MYGLPTRLVSLQLAFLNLIAVFNKRYVKYNIIKLCEELGRLFLKKNYGEYFEMWYPLSSKLLPRILV